MTLFPAIDILEGRAVRLLRGEKSQVTDYGTPIERAKLWVDAGTEWLHIVDLGGAFDGFSHINDTIYQISKLGVKIQSGGGLRSMDDISNRISAGAERVVLGTVAVQNPTLYKEAVDRYGAKIVAGIDAKDGMLAIKGWTEKSDITAVQFAKKAKDLGVRYGVFTDISRDGAMSGVAIDSTVSIQQESGLRIIASGGLSSMDELYQLRDRGVYGAILGRSIYNGAIELKEAIRVMKDAL